MISENVSNPLNKRLKVIHVTQAMGGVKTHIKYILNYLRADNFEQKVISSLDSDLQDYTTQNGIKHYILPFERSINFIKDFNCFIRLIKILKMEKPDLVHIHSAKAGTIARIACRFTNTQAIFTPNAFSYLSFKGLKRILFYGVEYMLRNQAFLAAVSYSEANRALHELGYSSSNVKVIPNSIEPLVRENPYKYDRPVLVISTIARVTAQKNLATFVEVASLLTANYPQLSFRILGSGYHDDQLDQVKALIKEKGLESNIQIIPWDKSGAVMNHLTNTDLYISTAIFEGLPYSVLEAMSLGIPCVLSNCDGNIDIVNHGVDGFIAINTDDFVHCIKSIIEDNALRQKVSYNAFKKVHSQFNINKKIFELEFLYKKLVNPI